MTAPVPTPSASGGPAPDRAPRRILPVIVLAQLVGTSPWFAVNAVMPDLQREFGWPAAAVGTLTSAVQLGFILGALLFALAAVADRYPARRVFLACTLAGALCAVGAAWSAGSFNAMLAWRALGGFFLAGIYPVGMKIAASWFPRGLGAALGLLIAALVLGSASPHALRAMSVGWPWVSVFYGVALASAAAGVLLYLAVPEAPRGPGRVVGLQLRALWAVAADARVRASVLGYFGHMWELYTMWVLVPALLATRLAGEALSWAAFGVLGAGALGCAGGGWLARRWGSARVAGVQLGISGLCCVGAIWLVDAPTLIFAGWLLLWGITVSGDSPQFSALTAQNAPPALVGSVLTLTNSIGFAISIVSIQLFTSLAETVPLASLLPWLGLGPLLGLWALRPLLRR
jgi:MFS transporter, DHA1 family, inner membrane transport protein